jgi:hypothetical protein
MELKNNVNLNKKDSYRLIKKIVNLMKILM